MLTNMAGHKVIKNEEKSMVTILSLGIGDMWAKIWQQFCMKKIKHLVSM